MIKLLAKLLRVLNSETEPGQISLGFGLAMIAGLTPLLSLHNLLVLLLVCVLRVNLSAFLLGLALCTGIAYALDPLFHQIGLAVLTAPALEGVWTALYQSVWWRLEHFNNSIVMGSLVFAVML
ncbi:MAG: TIGR03546 family protein, partial [Nitrospiraceae bacterium]|nr:TIGR03546 family protein [Nitrospiraceae bacterium]